MSEKKAKQARSEELKIEITVKDGGIDWKFSRDGVVEQQFLDILRIIEDQLLLSRAVREAKIAIRKEAFAQRTMKKNLLDIKQ